LLGRLVTDEGFRRQAATSLEAACRQGGYPLSQAELSLMSHLELQVVAALSGELNAGLRRAGGAA
jgi:hypothetical protein